MNLTHPEQPSNPPEDAQFFGPETDEFWACWFKFSEGQWWASLITRPEKNWFVANDLAHGAYTLGENIFMLEDCAPTSGLRRDAERLRANGAGQLRWANDQIEYFSGAENAWRKSGISKESFENRCPPLKDLNWPPRTQEGNDVDSW